VACIHDTVPIKLRRAGRWRRPDGPDLDHRQAGGDQSLRVRKPGVRESPPFRRLEHHREERLGELDRKVDPAPNRETRGHVPVLRHGRASAKLGWR
jgi:hypothetical protein